MATARTSAVRWAGGAVIALLAAVTVLIHHETPAIAAALMQHATHSTHTGYSMSGTASPLSAAAMPHGSAPGHVDRLGASAPAPGGDSCAGPGMQHCAAASVAVFELSVPPQGTAVETANLHGVQPGPLPAGTVGRAPPDLSVLSQLRI